MSEFITVQVGQCGNQIGSRFWPLALQEHGYFTDDVKKSLKKIHDEAFHSFFYNPKGKKCQSLSDLKDADVKARALLIDMEESVVERFQNGKLNYLFDKACSLTNAPGSGNNWAVGHYEHGREHEYEISEMLRISSEKCDNLHGFLMLFSLGGGTGSGLGTAVLKMIQDHFPRLERIVSCVHPGVNNDVVTSPYNIALSLGELIENASVVLPVDNKALLDLCDRLKLPKESSACYKNVNSIIAKMLLHLTSGARFPGTLNLDINELSTNMVPMEGLHFLSSSYNPVEYVKPKDVGLLTKEKDLLYGAFARDNQLLRLDPMNSVMFGATVLGRGRIKMSSLRDYVQRIKKKVTFPNWAASSVKVAHCAVPSFDEPESLLLLTNTTSMKSLFEENMYHFHRLYRRKAHLHHYTKVGGFEEEHFNKCKESIYTLLDHYDSLCKDITLPRLNLL